VAQEKTLSKFILLSAPEKAMRTVFPSDDVNLSLLCGYVASNRKLPTSAQLQSYARSNSTPLKYSEVAPLIKNFRAKMMDNAIGSTVKIADDFLVETDGQLRAWSENNETWKLDVWPTAQSRFNFTATKQPIIEVSEAFAVWLQP